jgi:predicted DsbA family dithiol-disulfide isomerase
MLTIRKLRRMAARSTLVLAAVAAGCAGDGTASPALSWSGGDVDASEVLATIGGEEIRLSDLDERIMPQLAQAEMQYRRERTRLIEEGLLITLRERLVVGEAERRGISMDELLAEASDVPLDPTPGEISAWYLQNQQRLGGNPLDQLRPQIAEHLRNERRLAAYEAVEARLREEREVRIRFEPFRLSFDNSRAPTLGPANAPVTLVEFSDFECPFCRAFAPTLKRLHETFGDDLQIVYRHYPITSIHPNAFKAAEASHCALEQGRFWELHDLIFAEMDRVSVTDLKEKARRIGLDGRRFDSCLDTGRYTELVQADIREAQMAGVNGTPTLFLNGVLLEGGAIPFDRMESLVRAELRRATR